MGGICTGMQQSQAAMEPRPVATTTTAPSDAERTALGLPAAMPEAQETPKDAPIAAAVSQHAVTDDTPQQQEIPPSEQQQSHVVVKGTGAPTTAPADGEVYQYAVSDPPAFIPAAADDTAQRVLDDGPQQQEPQPDAPAEAPKRRVVPMGSDMPSGQADTVVQQQQEQQQQQQQPDPATAEAGTMTTGGAVEQRVL
jgi:hypothetical protein